MGYGPSLTLVKENRRGRKSWQSNPKKLGLTLAQGLDPPLIYVLKGFSGFIINALLCSSRKYPYSPHRRDWNFLGGMGGGGSVRPKNLKKCLKLNWNFQRSGGGGGLRTKNPFCGRGMDIFGITHSI